MNTKRTKSQVGRYARTKGARFEREVAEAFKPLFPDARRGIGQTRCAGEVPDVTGTPFWVEGKFRQHLDLQKAMDQANRARAIKNDMRPPVVIWRKLRARSLCKYCEIRPLSLIGVFGGPIFRAADIEGQLNLKVNLGGASAGRQ